jgi:hypothetical protein
MQELYVHLFRSQGLFRAVAGTEQSMILGPFYFLSILRKGILLPTFIVMSEVRVGTISKT